MRVSIITISFNQARFIEQTIRSVIEQDYDDIEYIVVDAGSTDGSREIIEKYRDKISRSIFEPDKGPADGLNKGFRQACGDAFAFVNSDDLLLPGAVKKAVAALNANPAVDMVYGHGYVIDGENRIRKKVFADAFNPRRFAYRCVTFVQPSVFFRKVAYVDVGGFNCANSTCWDAELIADFALHGKRIMKIDEFLSGFRLHHSSISGSRRLNELYKRDWETIFRKITNRPTVWYDVLNLIAARLVKWSLNPRGVVQHLIDLLPSKPWLHVEMFSPIGRGIEMVR